MVARHLGICLLALTIVLRVVQLVCEVGNVPYPDDGSTVFTKFQKCEGVWQLKANGEVYLEVKGNGDLEMFFQNREGKFIRILIMEEMRKQPEGNRLYALEGQVNDYAIAGRTLKKRLFGDPFKPICTPQKSQQ